MSTKPSEQFQVTALIVLRSSELKTKSWVGGKSHEHCGRSAQVGKSGVLSCVSAVRGTPGGNLNLVANHVRQRGRL